jgi:ADP-ribosylglycohydrolase
MLPANRAQSFGEIRDYRPNRHVRLQPGEPVKGYPSDDTQLAFCTLEQLLADGGLVPVVTPYLRRPCADGEAVPEAYAQGLSVRKACDRWYPGAFLLETVPSVLYTLMKHADDLEEAIARALNDTKDNDTIAAIVGAAAGALHGRRAIPRRWIERLSGRTTGRDDACVADLARSRRRTAPG